jgi:hypothetical protein
MYRMVQKSRQVYEHVFPDDFALIKLPLASAFKNIFTSTYINTLVLPVFKTAATKTEQFQSD